MMGIRQVQIKNLLDVISHSYFAGGVNPQLNDILKHMSDYFAKNPPGLPIRLEKAPFENPVADEQVLNDLMAQMINNVDVLYEVCSNQVEELLLLNTVLRSDLDRLRIKRSYLESKIDDYLLGLYNSDGYFFSVSDQFIDGTLTDFSMTSAFVDVNSGTLSLPPVAQGSSTVRVDRVADPSIRVYSESGSELAFDVKTPFFNALDGLNNTAWFFEVRSDIPQVMTAVIDIDLATAYGSSKITKIDIIPHCVTPVQVGINARFNNQVYDTTVKPFTSSIKTSADKMTFIGENIIDNVSQISLTLVKNQYDRIENTANGQSFIYMFGMKELSLSEQYFDQFATYVSAPLSLPSDYGEDAVIDAVSLVADQSIPVGTNARFYVASDVPNASSIGDFSWIEIKPIGQVNGTDKGTVVSFNGAQKTSKMIRRVKQSNSDLLLYSQDSSSEDRSKWNPNYTIIPGVEVNRIADFSNSFIPDSITLEEGINTTKIHFTELDENAVSRGFDFWKEKFDTPLSYFTTYGEIDSGNQFFYGGDVGESGKSVYVETYVEVTDEIPVVLKQCTKSDPNSRTWNMRLFLNGREIANMPVGVNSLSVPWKFVKGRNHVAVLVNIPEATVEYPSPYIGSIEVMSDSSIQDFGTVKLANWSYVDFFKMQTGQGSTSNTFTIYNNEIISRKAPTDNYRVSYANTTNAGPDAVRVRIDLSRTSAQQNASPLVNSYRLRFSYS